MAIYNFVITITGEGVDPESAWASAVENLHSDPGEMPEYYDEQTDE